MKDDDKVGGLFLLFVFLLEFLTIGAILFGLYRLMMCSIGG